MKLQLYRASLNDYIPHCASFARHREDAEVYLNNRGFGGPILFRTKIEVTSEQVLNLYEERDPIGYLVRWLQKRGHDFEDPGAIGIEEWIPRDSEIEDAAQENGIDWIVVKDSFPEECETWIWVGPFEREPTLKEVRE